MKNVVSLLVVVAVMAIMLPAGWHPPLRHRRVCLLSNVQ